MSKSEKFKLSSGLPWADTTVTITDATFGFVDMKGNDPVLCLSLTGLNADGDKGEQAFSVGQGWEAVEGGARLQAENGKDDKPFSKQSNIGKLIASMITAVGGDPEDIPFDDPTVAGEWIGHVWETGTVSEPAKTMSGKPRVDDDGNPVTRDRIVFAKYVGAVEGQTKAVPAAKATTTKGSTKASSSDIPEELLAQLTTLAQESDDHDAFSDAALDIEDVANNSALVKRVMSAKPDGLYEQLKAS